MSRNYDNWEKLVGAVLRIEKDRQLAFCESFSTTTSSADFSSRFGSFSFNPFVEDVDVYDEVCGSSGQRFDPEYLSSVTSENIFFSGNVKKIEYEEIKKATRNFRIHEGIVATDLYAAVYKVWIHEEDLTATKPGCGIAVSVNIMNLEGFQQYKEWVNTLDYWSSLCHPNLVKLIGCSVDTQNRILVIHEFMGRGSLDNALRRERALFSRATRVKVARGTARALAFLHDLEVPFMNRNITTSNILFDGDFNTKLMYFDLGKDGATGVMGGFGYDAPEYIKTGFLTSKSDVYGFGLVLLGLMSGLRFIERNRPNEMQNVMDWAKPYLRDKDRVWRIMDRTLEGQYTEKEAFEVG